MGQEKTIRGMMQHLRDLLIEAGFDPDKIKEMPRPEKITRKVQLPGDWDREND